MESALSCDSAGDFARILAQPYSMITILLLLVLDLSPLCIMEESANGGTVYFSADYPTDLLSV